MSIAIWPSELPQRSLLQPFQASTRGNRLITSTDTGPGKQRKRGPAIRPVSCSIIVDYDQRARFDTFYEEDVSFGVSPFLIPDQQMDGIYWNNVDGIQLLDDFDVSIIIESWWLVQFGKTQPSTGALGGLLFSINFELVVLP